MAILILVVLLCNTNVMGVLAAPNEAPNPEVSGILEEPVTGVEYILYNPDKTTSTSGKPIIFVFHGIESSESELDAGGGLAAYQLICRDVIKPNALIVFVRKDYGNWADNSEYSLKSQIYATFIHNMLASTGADTSRVYYYGFSMGAWDGPAIIKASGEGTFKAAVFNDGNPFVYITNDELEQYVLNNNGGINGGNGGNQNNFNNNEKRGAIFIGESHVHKLEEGMTPNDIAWEQPSTYLSNTIKTQNKSYIYDYGVNGNGNNGNIFFIHTLSAVGATEPEYGTPGQGTQQAFPEWLYDGDGTTNGIRTYQGTATAFERAKKIISSNPDIDSWTVVVMQGYFTPGLGVGAWDKYISNLNSMKSALSQLGCANFYVSSTPHTNADIWEQETCYAYGRNAVIQNLQGADSNALNTNIDQYNSYVSAKMQNYINVTDTSGNNPLGKDGNAYRQYKTVGMVDASFSFDRYAHIDMNHYDASTMYAWAEYVLTYIDAQSGVNNGNNINGNNGANQNGNAHNWLGLKSIYLIEGIENHYEANAGANTERGRNALFLASFAGNLKIEDHSGKTQDWVNGFGAAQKNGDAAVTPWNCMEAGDAYNWLLQQ